MRVAHIALELGLGHERGDRVDHDDVDRPRADEHVCDLERLLPRVGLRDEEFVDVDAQLLRVLRVERVLRVDERRDAAATLCIGDRVERDRGLARGLGPVDLDDTAARESADAERNVKRNGPARDHLDWGALVAAESHDRPFTELPIDLRQCRLERLGLIRLHCHGVPHWSSCVSAVSLCSR